MPLPHLLLQPPIFPLPFLAPLFPPFGPLAWSIRLTRLVYTLFFSYPLILFSSLLASLTGWSFLPTFPGRDRSTNTVVPLIASLIWSGTWGFLSPPALVDEFVEGEKGTRLSVKLLGKGIVKVKGVVVEKAAEKWCRGVVRDGFGGKVKGRGVRGSWLWKEKEGENRREGDEDAQKGERVVVYVVGGE